MSQYKVAQLAGTYQQNINTLINGEIHNVSSVLVWNICCAFGITLKEFYDDPLFDEIKCIQTDNGLEFIKSFDERKKGKRSLFEKTLE